ncbi:MAG: metallophosphoesterase family protein [Planctomycetota bacterium]
MTSRSHDARLGLLSDSHGRRERTARAVAMLREAGATTLVHLGDVEDPELLEDLLIAGDDGRPLSVHLVAGNMDEPSELKAAADRLGIEFHHPGGEIEVAGRRVAFTHGDRDAEVRRLLASRPDYLCHGHTHLAADHLVEGVRVVNPGALHRARPHSVAVLEVDSGRLESIEVRDD